MYKINATVILQIHLGQSETQVRGITGHGAERDAKQAHFRNRSPSPIAASAQ